MQHRVVSFIILVFFRVFLVPAWFSLHVDEIRDAGETYEHIRLKKRRVSFLEENILAYEVIHGPAALASPEKRAVFFHAEHISAMAPSLDAGGHPSLISNNIVRPLYLRNRMLRI